MQVGFWEMIPGNRNKGMKRAMENRKKPVTVCVDYCCGQVSLNPAGKPLRNHTECISELFLYGMGARGI